MSGSRVGRARRYFIAAVGATIGLLGATVILGLLLGERSPDTVGTIGAVIVIVALGVGLPLCIVTFVDLARSSREAGLLSIWTDVSGLIIRILGLAGVCCGVLILVGVVASVFDASAPTSRVGSRHLRGLITAVVMLAFGLRWLVRPFARLPNHER